MDNDTELRDPNDMTRDELIAEITANRIQIEHDKESYRQARDFLGEKLREYDMKNELQEEVIHTLEKELDHERRINGCIVKTRDPTAKIPLISPIIGIQDKQLFNPILMPSKCK